jgi:CDP-glycerol glycerophosphotransferase (TagB/SpsB family)
MKSFLKSIIRKLLPEKVKFFLRKIMRFTQRYQYKLQQKRYLKIAENVKKKDKITVAFFLIHVSVWKCENVYRLLEKDDRFDPVIVVCPYITYGDDNMLEEMQAAYNFFQDNSYNVVRTYNEKTNEWLDVKATIKPDIVFFTNPHKLTKDEYYIYNYLDTLTCYVQYAFHICHLNEMHYNQAFHNLLWKAFYETPVHKALASQYALNKGRNVVITGYPGIDVFLDKLHRDTKDVWKIKDRNIKRIIWAPHQTIDNDKNVLSFSTFLLYHQFMIDIAKKYQDKIQITFKPHPLLKNKLQKHEEWGKERTESYYKMWEDLPNGQLNESSYIDMFVTSDAMILDSVSFIVEYLTLNKPSLFLFRDEQIEDRLNDFGKMSLQELYHGKNKDEIVYFIENVVLNGIDEKEKHRKQFIREFLLPPNNLSASENIYNEFVRVLSCTSKK